MGRRPKNELQSIQPEQIKIGRQLAKIRKFRGLTQLQLAEKAGITRSVIADYERGKCRIHDVMLIWLANALEVSPNKILCFDKKNSDDIVPSLRLMKRIRKMEKLPAAKQKVLLQIIDSYLKSNSIE